MRIKVSRARKAFNIGNTAFLIFLALVMLYPVWHVLCASFSEDRLLLAHNGVLLKPRGFSFAAYKMAFTNNMILRSYINTIIIVVTGVVSNLIMTILAAYVLSRKNVCWVKPLNLLIIFTMFFSGGLIPTYLLVSKTLHLNNTYLAVILPGLINTYNLMIMRTSFAGIPDSLIEAATLDGASQFRTIWRIVVPLSKAVVSVMILYYAVGHWNAWFRASIYLTKRDMFPLQLILREILISNDTSSMSVGVELSDQASVGETIKYAVIVIATAPILCIYPFVQKYFVQGVMIGAVKG